MQFDIIKNYLSPSDCFRTEYAFQEIGALHKQLSCILLSQYGDNISFFCPSYHTQDAWVLEIEELHQTLDPPFSYEILINDQFIHLRTMEPLSTTVFPYFIKLDLHPGDKIEIRNHSDSPIRITGLYLHADLQTIEETYAEPMEIGLCFPRFSGQDRQQDLQLMQQIHQDFSDLKHFTVGIGVEIKYMLLSDEELKTRLSYFLDLAREANVNLIFNYNTWWDGTPEGRDGKGGYFSDIEYQQVVYDPLTGHKFLSIPNLWRNTPWYTMNHPHLNQVRKERLAVAIDLLGQALAVLRCHRTKLPSVRLLIDNEPTYWAEFAYSASPESGGDFNEYCIQAARKDGVDLEPNGSLREDQKLWLLHNLETYMTDISRAYFENTSKTYASVCNGKVLYEEGFLTENTFTHIVPHTGHPYADGKHFHYEEHVNPWTRLGVEAAGFQDERLLSYMNGTGRFAQINAERCCYTSPEFHCQFYAHGAVCDIIFNYYYDTDIRQLHQLDQQLDQMQQQEPVYGKPIAHYRSYDGQLTGGRLIATENLEIAPLRERKVLRPASLGKGYLILSIGRMSDYPWGGWLELTGLFRPDNGSLTISLSLGSFDQSTVKRVLPERNADFLQLPYRIPFTDFFQNWDPHSEEPLFLRIDFENQYYDDWAQMNAIWEIRSMAAWDVPTPSRALPFTLPEYRAFALAASYRTDCRRLLSESGLVDPFPDRDDYKALSLVLLHLLSVRRTDQFLLRGKGILEKYGLEADSGNDLITLRLQQHGETALQQTNSSDVFEELSRKTTGTDGSFSLLLQLEGQPGASLQLRKKGFLLAASQTADDKYLLTGHAGPENEIQLTIPEYKESLRHFTGTFLSYSSEQQRIEVTTHDIRDWNWQSILRFSCPDSVPVTLCPAAVTGTLLEHISISPYTPAAIRDSRIDPAPTIRSLKKGDAVTLTLAGNTVIDIAAIRGLARGKIKKIIPQSLTAPMHNPFLMVETAPGLQVTFELGSVTRLNYEKARCSNPLLSEDPNLGLSENLIVLIAFEPETTRENCYRALEVTLV